MPERSFFSCRCPARGLIDPPYGRGVRKGGILDDLKAHDGEVFIEGKRLGYLHLFHYGEGDTVNEREGLITVLLEDAPDLIYCLLCGRYDTNRGLSTNEVADLRSGGVGSVLPDFGYRFGENVSCGQ